MLDLFRAAFPAARVDPRPGGGRVQRRCPSPLPPVRPAADTPPFPGRCSLLTTPHPGSTPLALGSALRRPSRSSISGTSLPLHHGLRNYADCVVLPDSTRCCVRCTSRTRRAPACSQPPARCMATHCVMQELCGVGHAGTLTPGPNSQTRVVHCMNCELFSDPEDFSCDCSRLGKQFRGCSAKKSASY